MGTVKVKRLLPGGITGDDPATEYTNENLRAPTGIPALINDAIAERGIEVTIGVYENMAVGDRIQLNWGGLSLTRPALTEPEVGKLVTFRVEKATLIAAPGQVIVRYDIRDEVNNWSRWSLHASTDVEAGDNLLIAPRVLNTSNGAIDLALLLGEDAEVQTPVYTKRMELGDQVRLTWTGFTAEGVQLEDVILDKTVGTGDIDWPLTFLIPNDKVRAIAQGNAVVRYEVTPLAGQRRQSRRTSVNVIGQVAQLPAPAVPAATGNVLDPAGLPPEGAVVRIASSELIAAGDTILLLWEGKTASGGSVTHTITIPVTGSVVGKPIERLVPLAYITPLLNGSVTVSYTLNKSGGETLTSQPLLLQVRSQTAQLPKPKVDYAMDDSLDPEAVPATGTAVRVNYSPMLTADRIDLHWDGVLDHTDFFPVPTNWNNKEVPFPIEKTSVDLNKDQTVQVFYTVTRAGTVMTSIKQPLLIGSAVKLGPPSIKEAMGNSLNPIAAKDALNAVVPAYANMIGTQLRVTWTGTAGAGSHTTELVTVTTQGTQEIALDNKVVAFNLALAVTVTYEVIRNGGTPTVSDVLTLAVQTIPISELKQPRILEAADNGNGNELNLSDVANGATIRVDSWPLIAVGQYVWLRLKGRKTNGDAHETNLWSPPSSRANDTWISQGYLDKAVPAAYLKELGDGTTLTVEFKAALGKSQTESEAVSFPVKTYTVKAGVGELPKPSIKEASGTSLAPIAAKDKLTAVVPQYPGMLASDLISVTWAGTAGNGSHTTTAVEVGTVGSKEIELLNSVVAFNLGQVVSVIYKVTRGTTSTPSDPLSLTVQKITESDLQLSMPVINGITGSELDVTTLPAGAKTRIAGWPFIALRQRIWLHYFVEGDSTPIHTEYAGDEIPSAGLPSGMNPNTPVDKLKALTNGAKLRVEFKVSFDGSTDEGKAVSFPVRTYSVNAALLEDFEGWAEAYLGGPGSPIQGTTMDIYYISGGGTVEIKKSAEGKFLYINSNGYNPILTSLRLKGRYWKISFLPEGVASNINKIKAYNEKDEKIIEISILPSEPPAPMTIFHDIHKIARIDFLVQETITVDNFIFGG
ncbi:hypothetical protein PS718_02270 [Pseudomonas fluorescens]|uniref:Uncharacterized protein n=1 Tax=Pseudomonas fluorescens TaxID=294 RepID=A0A5E7BU55_PSEFL|nr:hypothetical protein [Pseudomonas fluorescens]VVN95972.1 hypothetical protein PS718_02270 [Pseudomonas fluorescens]